jgi:hypothetical protein
VERTISLTLNRIRLWPSNVGNETPHGFCTSANCQNYYGASECGNLELQLREQVGLYLRREEVRRCRQSRNHT